MPDREGELQVRDDNLFETLRKRSGKIVGIEDGRSVRGSTASGTTYSHFSLCPISAFYSTPTSTLLRQQDNEDGFRRKLQLAITCTYYLVPIRPTIPLLLP